MNVQEVLKEIRIVLTPTATTMRNVEDFLRTNNIHNVSVYTADIRHDDVLGARELLEKGVADLYSADISTLEAMFATAPLFLRIYSERICCIPQ